MALILNMPMQENVFDAQINDISASNNNAFFGAVNTADISTTGPGGAFPSALDFGIAGGSPDFAQFTTAIELNAANRTICFFAKFPNHLDPSPIFGHDADFEWLLISTVHIELQNLSGTGQRVVSDTQNWHHYGLTSSGGNWSLFLDGVSVGAFSQAMTGQLLIHRIGCNADFGPALSLVVAGLKIYDEVRTGAQIAADYQEGLSGSRFGNTGAGFDFGFGFGF